MKLLERAYYHIINTEVDWKTALEADIIAHTQLRPEGCTCCTSVPWGMGERICIYSVPDATPAHVSERGNVIF